MNILTIPIRNIRRRPSKSLLLLLVFSLGVMSIVALYQVSQVVGHSLEKKLTAFGANIIVSPVTQKLSVSYGGFHMGDMLFDVQDLPEDETVSAIRSIELKNRISTVAPKLVTTTKLNSTALALVGVRWDDERAIKSYWAVEGEFPINDNQIVVGSKAAAQLGMQTGDKTQIMGSEFTISGVLYETGGDDDGVVFMDLVMLQTLSGRPGATSFIEVAALCAGCPIEEIVAQLRNQLPAVEVKALQKVVNQRMASVKFVQKLALSISLVILVTATSMVGLSMLSAVNERKKDIGILRSLGYSKGKIFLIFCLEAAVIGVLAGVTGYLAGFGASFKILELLTMAQSIVPIFSLPHLFLAGLFFGIITIIAAMYPAYKGAGIEPSTALVAL